MTVTLASLNPNPRAAFGWDSYKKGVPIGIAFYYFNWAYILAGGFQIFWMAHGVQMV